MKEIKKGGWLGGESVTLNGIKEACLFLLQQLLVFICVPFLVFLFFEFIELVKHLFVSDLLKFLIR